MFESLNVSLVASDVVSKSLNSIANSAEQAGDAAIQTGVEFGTFGEALNEVSSDAIGMIMPTNAATGAVDELGDEATETAGELTGLSAAMATTGSASVGMRAQIAGISGSMSTMTSAATALAPALMGVGAALGGLGTAAGAAGGGIAALAAGGLMNKAENMAAASSQFKTSGEAMKAMMTEIKSAFSEALAPLKSAANTEFVINGINGAVQLVGMLAESIASMAPLLRKMGNAFGSAALATAPAIFAEIEQTVRSLMPATETIHTVIGQIPSVIAFMRMAAMRLKDELWGLAVSTAKAAMGVTRFGITMAEILIPPLSVALNMLGWLGGLLGKLPKAFVAASAAAILATAVMAIYGGVTGAAAAATSVVTGAIAALLSPVTAVAVAIGLLVGAVVGIITYFGWWDDIIGALMAIWNGFVGIIEFAVEMIFGIMTAIEQLLGPLLFLFGPLGALIWVFTNLGTIIGWVGDMFSWFGDLANNIISTVMGWVDTAISAIQDLMSWALKVVNMIPGVNIDFGKIQKEIDFSGLKAGGDDGKDDPKKEKSKKTKKETKNHYDFRGANFGGSASQTERNVQEAITEANQEDRAREDAHHY